MQSKSNDLRRVSPHRFSLRIVADAKGHESGASPDTKRHESGLLRVPSKCRLERLMVARASTRGHWGHMGRLGRNGGVQDAGAFRVGSRPAKAGFVSDDATTPEGFGKSAAAGEAKPQARARRSWRISSQDDTAHRRLSWPRVSARVVRSVQGDIGDIRGAHRGAEACACQSMIWQRGLPTDCVL